MSAPQAPKKGRKWPWIVGGILALGLVMTALEGGGDEDTATEAAPTTTTTSRTSTPAPEPTTAEAEPVAVDPEPAPTAGPYTGPTLIPLPLPMAEERAGLDIDAVDIGQYIVDTVDRERAIFDSANWRVVTTCDTTDGDELKVGVIKSDEFAAISAAGRGALIAENGLTFTLDCP